MSVGSTTSPIMMDKRKENDSSKYDFILTTSALNCHLQRPPHKPSETLIRAAIRVSNRPLTPSSLPPARVPTTPQSSPPSPPSPPFSNNTSSNSDGLPASIDLRPGLLAVIRNVGSVPGTNLKKVSRPTRQSSIVEKPISPTGSGYEH
ncbi:5948_t:CDS:2 [Entrophospora sp. SA101]|nr:14812_t:CDS:2 [Entrophospora sp. SA101]CAJ0629501.1 5948_t:CDS:2 [Entrophospora sp. SA101]CAJ0841513.1 14490_t:CDS:2 [Entrophospora sp. SA101]